MRSVWEAIAHHRGRLNSNIVRAIEPVTRLLGQPQSDRWPRSAKQSAARVFINYICLDRWDVDGINHLISLPVATLPMLEALERMLKLATDCDTLQHLLDDKADVCLKGVVEFTSTFVSRKRDKIGQWPVLKEPLKLFLTSNNSAVQDLAGNILVRLDAICRCTGRPLLQRLGVEGPNFLRTVAVNEPDLAGIGDLHLNVLQRLVRQDNLCCHLRQRWIQSKIAYILNNMALGHRGQFFYRLSVFTSALVYGEHIGDLTYKEPSKTSPFHLLLSLSKMLCLIIVMYYYIGISPACSLVIYIKPSLGSGGLLCDTSRSQVDVYDFLIVLSSFFLCSYLFIFESKAFDTF